MISPALSTIDGVAQVQIFGSQKYAVRIQIDPNALAARGIGVDEVQTAITAANANTPVGTLQNDKPAADDPGADTQLANADQFPNIIIATRDGKPVRLGDVAKVIDSVENNQTASWYDGTRAIVLGGAAPARRQHRRRRRPRQGDAAGFRASSCRPPPRIQLLNDRSTSIRAGGRRRAAHAAADDRAGRSW